MDYLEAYIIPYLISNGVALLILWAAWRKPILARFLFFLLFAWACVTNFTMAWTNPNDYLLYSAMAISVYRDFIEGWFSDHIVLMVSLIAFGQGLIAIGMILRNQWVRIACWGAIIFLMAIAPLGVGSGFPFSITASVAAWLILRRKDLDFLWKFKSVRTSV